MKLLILVTLTILTSTLAFAGPDDESFGTRNGGSYSASQFYDEGQILLQKLSHRAIIKLDDQTIDIEKLTRLFQKTKIVISENNLILNGSVVDAINYPQVNRIELNSKTWPNMNTLQRKRIILHEILGVAGLKDPQYKTSQALVEIADMGNNWDLGYRPNCQEERLLSPEKSAELTRALKWIQNIPTSAAAIKTTRPFSCVTGENVAGQNYYVCDLQRNPRQDQSELLIKVLRNVGVASYTRIERDTEVFDIFYVYCQSASRTSVTVCSINAYWSKGCRNQTP